MANTNRYQQSIAQLCETGHRTAEQIRAELKKSYPRSLISLGTVYRNLTNLVNEGILMKQHALGDKMIYEKSKAYHGHLFCQHSGMIEDIDISALSFGSVSTPAGFVLQDIQVTFAGHYEGTSHGYCQISGSIIRK